MRLDLDRAFGDFSLGLTGLAEGDRYDDAGNTRRQPGREWLLTLRWSPMQ